MEKSIKIVIDFVEFVDMVIRKEFLELEEFLRGDSLWSDSYFAETVGKMEEEVLRKYIDEQRK